LSVELQGERRPLASIDDTPTQAKTNALGVSGSVEDDRKWPKKLHNASERKCAHPEQAMGGNSPRRPPDDLDDPSSKASVTDGVQSHQRRPRADRDHAIDEIDGSY